jgi:hypothetical protein
MTCIDMNKLSNPLIILLHLALVINIHTRQATLYLRTSPYMHNLLIGDILAL